MTAECHLDTAPCTMPQAQRASQDVTAILARLLAARHAVTELELAGEPVHLDGTAWFDTRRMTDAALNPDQFLAMNADTLAYGLHTGLFGVHPQRPYLFAVVNEAGLPL